MYDYKGSKSNLLDYLFNNLKIISPRPQGKRPDGKYELTPVLDQIEKIISTEDKTGKIYFTDEYTIKEINEHNEEILSPAFKISHVKVKIVE